MSFLKLQCNINTRF